LAAYRQLTQPIPTDIKLVVGIELSCVWRRMTIHIVGLNVDPDSVAMHDAEKRQRAARTKRFETIIERLNKLGLSIDAEDLISTSGSCPGRPHIARYLVETGQVKSERHAFDRLLGQGKVGDVKECWPELSEVVSWILAAGGAAVLAHPIKYGLTRTKLLELVSDFKEAGGVAIEVISGQQNPQQTKTLVEVANKFDLLGSQGSDFHRPEQPWASLGRVAQLPEGIKPVWSFFD
jgi:3',5'-nucleoside bisphosphate phosphatase